MIRSVHFYVIIPIGICKYCRSIYKYVCVFCISFSGYWIDWQEGTWLQVSIHSTSPLKGYFELRTKIPTYLFTKACFTIPTIVEHKMTIACSAAAWLVLTHLTDHRILYKWACALNLYYFNMIFINTSTDLVNNQPFLFHGMYVCVMLLLLFYVLICTYLHTPDMSYWILLDKLKCSHGQPQALSSLRV